MSFEIETVISYALKKHSGQERKGSGLPYIVHPIAVLELIGTNWNIKDVDLWKAAICHDVLEDTNATFEELVSVIGKGPSLVVKELTFEEDSGNLLPKHQQKAEYMKTFMDKSVDALVIKCADRFCNVFDFIASSPDYARKYWRKADDLMDSMFSRENDIVAKFGADAFANMQYTRTVLTQQLT